MPNLIIPQNLAQAIADYLAGQPYRDVAPLIAGLSQLKAPAEPSNANGAAEGGARG